jgi:hypothetical protein
MKWSALFALPVLCGCQFVWNPAEPPTPPPSTALVCTPPATTGYVQPPGHVGFVRWDFEVPGATLQIDARNNRDPGPARGTSGEYVGHYGSISGHAFYFGMQTNMGRPGTPEHGFKGFVFSRWDSQDAADTHIAFPDGYREIGKQDGAFVGVRRHLAWAEGNYRMTLRRNRYDGVGDWFELWVTPPTGPTWLIGALRFPRNNPALPAQIAPTVTSFAEVYSVDPVPVSHVPTWDVSLAASIDGRRAAHANAEYPLLANGSSFPNITMSPDPSVGGARIAFGNKVGRCGADGPLL